MKKKLTLAYAVAFCFEANTNFQMGKKIYQYVATVYDQREDGRGSNTVAVVYDFAKQEYKAINVDLPEWGAREIIIMSR